MTVVFRTVHMYIITVATTYVLYVGYQFDLQYSRIVITSLFLDLFCICYDMAFTAEQ